MESNSGCSNDSLITQPLCQIQFTNCDIYQFLFIANKYFIFLSFSICVCFHYPSKTKKNNQNHLNVCHSMIHHLLHYKKKELHLLVRDYICFMSILRPKNLCNRQETILTMSLISIPKNNINLVDRTRTSKTCFLLQTM